MKTRPILTGIPILAIFIPLCGMAATILVPEQSSLEEAIAGALAGDEISLASGVYEVSPTVEISIDNLTLRGRTGNPSDVCLQPQADGFGIFHVDASVGVLIQDLCLRGVVAANGSAIYSEYSSNFQVRNCLIDDNSSFFLGAVTLRDSFSIIRDCTFTSNSSVGFGGGLFFFETDGFANTCVIDGCVFRDNRASAGAAIGCFSNLPAKDSPAKGDLLPAQLIVFDSRIESGTASAGANGYGGGLFIAAAAQVPLAVTIENTVFDRCAATQSGGAVAIARGGGDIQALFSECAFTGNLAAAGHGGAIYLLDSFAAPPEPPAVFYRSQVTLATCTIESNTADLNGGGIAVDTGVHFTTLAVRASDFLSNRGRNGGGMCLSSLNPLMDSFEVRGSRFVDNSADGAIESTGGGICLVGTHSVIQGNEFSSNFSQRGGGLGLVGDGSLIAENRIGFPGLIGNDSEEGGGIYIQYEALFSDRRPRIVNNLIVDNYAFDEGGGLLVRTNGAILNPRGFVGGNCFLRNFTLDVIGEAAVLDGSLGDDFLLVHNSFIDHTTGGIFNKGIDPRPASVILLRNGAEPVIQNNLIANPRPRSIAGILEEGDSQPSVISNAFYNVDPVYIDNTDVAIGIAELNDLVGADGNFETDPLLAGPEGVFTVFTNPHLSRDSPLIGMASELVGLLEDLPVDFDALLDPPGDERIFGEAADIGADEVGPSPTPTPSPTPVSPGDLGVAFCFDTVPNGLGEILEDDPPVGTIQTGVLGKGAQILPFEPPSPQAGSAICFDGSDDFLEVADPMGELSFPVSATGTEGSFTVSSYVYVDVDSLPLPAEMTLCWKGPHNFNDHNYRLTIGFDGTFRLVSGNTGGVSDGRQIEPRRWTHLAAYIDGEARTVQYFLDFVATNPIPDLFIGMESDEPLVIGSRPQNITQFFPFKGCLDKFRIANGFDPYLQQLIEENPTPTPTATPEPAETPTPDCNFVVGPIDPRCDALDLLVVLRNLRGEDTGIDTDLDDDGNDIKDLLRFSLGWYYP